MNQFLTFAACIGVFEEVRFWCCFSIYKKNNLLTCCSGYLGFDFPLCSSTK